MIGRSLAHYRILEKLGSGGMGEVFLAEDTRLERRVALKVLAADVASDPEYLERFRFEARAIAAVNHPNIVTVHSVEEAEGRHFITMEYVDGGSFADRRPADGSIGEIAGWAVPLADALATAHEAGIVHRDLKPGNVMVNARGEVKILDFGLAKRLTRSPEAAATRVGALVGTVAYMAPEQLRKGEVDERTDLFAAGVLLYEMATGRHPFVADHGDDMGAVIEAILYEPPAPLSEVRPGLGPALDAIVARCLQKEPAGRYQSATDLHRALLLAAAESGVSTVNLPPLPAPERRTPRRPAVWTVPHLRNLNFTGRETELDELARLFASAERSVPLVAVAGLGGVGKTQLAVEYAHRQAGDLGFVLWVPAEEPAGLRGRYAALARELGLATHRDVERTVARVREWLGDNGGWLLVIDNAESPAAIRPYLPPGGAGQVLVTSRNPAWRGLGQVLELETWGAEAAARFLARRTGDEDAAAAGELSEALGGLPLALEQAAAYIEASGQSLSSYTRLYGEQRLRLLAKEEDATQTSTESVVTTWDLSFRQVAGASPAAEQLLHLCAFLDPDDIPLELLAVEPDLLPEALARAATDQLAMDEALAALLRFSLISRMEDSLSVHRLLQAVVRRSLGAEARPWAERALGLVARAFPAEGYREVDVWPRCSRLLPHALVSLGRVDEDPPVVAAKLLESVGSYLDGRGEYQEARSYLERAVRVEQEARGPDHLQVAKRLNSLGRVLTDLGRAEEARDTFARALAIEEAALGPDHPRVAARLNNLATALTSLARWDESEELLERALRIDEAAFGPDHPAVSMRLINLGVMYGNKAEALGAKVGGEQARDELLAARERFERALRIDEAAFGPRHPRVAGIIGNLGAVFNEIGDWEAARRYQVRALEILESSYGPDHPSLARPLRNLGAVLRALGRPGSARAHLMRALEIERQVWGGTHPDEAETLERLGLLAQDQGHEGEARRLFESSLEKLEEYLGPGHPDTSRVRERLRELDT